MNYTNAVITFIFAMFLMGGIAFGNPVVTESTSNSTVNTTGKTETTVKSPPPSAI